MTLLSSVRVQRQVVRLLGELEEAVISRRWEAVRDTSHDVLALEPDNVDAQAFLAAAKRALGEDDSHCVSNGTGSSSSVSIDHSNVSGVVINGRYTLGRMIGEGARKRVYEAMDSLLDREVAIAIVKIEMLDGVSRQRITLEAQAMGRLGSHPHVVTVFDFGEYVPEGSTEPHPYMVTELMRGGDVACLIENAPNGGLLLDDVVRVAADVCRGLDFTHANGIVHRDVKPGNIWLTKDGTAKIGDFGLAMSRNRARITQSGNIVGTVTYMPPEQITGGEVTPRADLYGLGVVLYEMVCGRPPFMGYDTPSVVRQHLETEPVSPTWHNPYCPRPLEALILRMMAKDPKRRPRSSADVIKALEDIHAGGTPSRVNGSSSGRTKSMSVSTESLNGDFGGVFVGRGEQMDVLRASLEETMSGRGRFLMIEGELGIGKSRMAHELAVYAGERGAKVLWGTADEAGAATSYWPWVQAIRMHVQNTDAEQLKQEMGDGASEIAVVVADVRQKLVGLESPPDLDDPQQPSFRLYDAVTGFLKAASDDCPLVIVFDDIQRADDSTLALLRFIVPELSTMRVLLVGTMLPSSTLPGSHPLTEILTYFKRRRLLQRVLLSALSMDEVDSIVRHNYGFSLSPTFIKGIYSQTKGNPLALSEVANTLLSQASPNSTKG